MSTSQSIKNPNVSTLGAVNFTMVCKILKLNSGPFESYEPIR